METACAGCASCQYLLYLQQQHQQEQEQQQPQAVHSCDAGVATVLSSDQHQVNRLQCSVQQCWCVKQCAAMQLTAGGTISSSTPARLQMKLWVPCTVLSWPGCSCIPWPDAAVIVPWQQQQRQAAAEPRAGCNACMYMQHTQRLLPSTLVHFWNMQQERCQRQTGLLLMLSHTHTQTHKH